MRLWDEIMPDAAAHLHREPGRLTTILGLVTSRGVQAVLLYRLGSRANKLHLSLLSAFLQRIAQLVYTVDINYHAQIGPGFVLRHAMGVVIGRDVIIGNSVTLYQGVTLGNRMVGSAERPDGMPIIADHVTVGAGACILGPVSIGSGSFIGANATLTSSVPPNSVVKSADVKVHQRRA